MPNYWSYNSDGSVENMDEPPNSGYYYVSEVEWDFSFIPPALRTYHLFEANPGAPDFDRTNWENNSRWNNAQNIPAAITSDGTALEWVARPSDARLSGIPGDRLPEADMPPPRTPVASYDAGIPVPDNSILRPGESLVRGDEGSGSTLTSENNGYQLTLNERGDLVLADSQGNELWGYSGADAADLLSSPDNNIRLMDDGSIAEVDEEGVTIQVIREAGDTLHAELILLYHPAHVSTRLRQAIEETQDALQIQVDCFGDGQPDGAAEVSEFLHNEGLTDENNESALTRAYNYDYLRVDTIIKDEFSDIDRGIADVAVATALANNETFVFIMDEIGGLNDQLRAVDESVFLTDTATIDGVHEQVVTRLGRDVEIRLFRALGETVEDVAGLIEDANQRNQDTEREVDTTEHSAGYQSAGNVHQATENTAQSAPPIGMTPVPTEAGFAPTATGGLGPAAAPSSSDMGAGDALDPPPLDTGTNSTDAAPGSDGLAPLERSIRQDSGIAEAVTSTDSNGSEVGMMMPAMMIGTLAPLMQRLTEQRQKDAERSERERESERIEHNPQQHSGTTQPAPTTPPSADATAPPPVIPPAGAAGIVDARLPNGTSQRVTIAVAEAINRELNNPNGSNAQAAYAGILADSTPVHSWNSVDVSSVRTGDVVQWENRSALVISTPEGLSYITNGQMVPLDPNKPVEDGHGDYGAFQGFFRPTPSDFTAPVDTVQSEMPDHPPSISPPPPSASPAAST